MNSVSNNQRVTKIITMSIAVIIIVLVMVYALLPHNANHTMLLDQLPRAYLLFDGLTLNMDGSPEETFWLRKGLEYPIDDSNARDGKVRRAWRWFDLTLERWQVRGISMELGINMLPGTESLTFLVNGKLVTTTETTPGYQVLTFNIPDEDLIPGSNKVTVKLNGGDMTALVDYVRWHIGSSNTAAKPEGDKRLIDGKEVPVIGSSGPYEMNFYVAAHLHSHLQLTIGHDRQENSGEGSKLRIWYRGYSSGEKLLWEGDYPAKGSKKLDLELGNFKEELVLLSFYSKPKTEAEDWFYIASPEVLYPAPPPIPEPKSPLVMNDKAPRTIVLIFEDAMRRDMLSVYGNKVVKTPNLEQIARSGMVFENCYAPSNHTQASFSGMFTSLPFTKNGANDTEAKMVGDVPTLAGILSQNNWSTVFFTSNPKTGPNLGIPRGFTEIYLLYELLLNTGKYSLEEYSPWLQNYLAHLSPKSDSFIVLHLMDTHEPVIAPTNYLMDYAMVYDRILEQMPWLCKSDAGFAAKVVIAVVQLYAIQTYVDDKLPSLIEMVARYRDPGNTIFILLSDHGEELLDHNAFGHGETLFEETIHIPLIIWGDGVVPARCKQYVSSIDLMPTILDLAGIESPQGIEGISFAGKLGGDETVQARPIFSSVAMKEGFKKSVVLEPWKLTYNDNMPELFNLAADPCEMNNQYTTNQLAFGYMRGILHEWWLGIFAQGIREDKNQSNLPQRDIEILKGLGYTQK